MKEHDMSKCPNCENCIKDLREDNKRLDGINMTLAQDCHELRMICDKLSNASIALCCAADRVYENADRVYGRKELRSAKYQVDCILDEYNAMKDGSDE